ncbi:MAG: DUF4440 domain-containing protein [Actinomycetota bacterium]
MTDAWVTEIEELHAFFEAYFLGTISVDDISRFAEVLDPHFEIVAPNGSVSDRAGTITAVSAGHGHAVDMAIITRDHQLVHADDAIVVASYVERHEWSDGRENERLSTVVFHRDDTKPNGLRWRRVHETWTQHESLS